MESTKQLDGLFAALITPFTEDGAEIDQPALTAHIERLIRAGVHGVVANSTTGEFASLSFDERKVAITTCVEAADHRIPVIAGTTGLNTFQSIALSRHAAEVGADAIMVMPPLASGLTKLEIQSFLSEIWVASKLPIMYYNNPEATGITISPDELAGLAEVPGVQYIKDTSGNADTLTKLLTQHDSTITTFNGWSTMAFLGMAAGAPGAIWCAPNVLPERCVELWDTVVKDGDLIKGRQLWAELYPVCEYFTHFNVPGAVKAGARLTGSHTGPVRKPYFDLDSGQSANLASLLDHASSRHNIV